MSPDGHTLYYSRGRLLFARAVEGGEERRIADSIAAPGTVHQFVPVEDGIYFVSRPDESRSPRELRFFDTRTMKTQTLGRFEAQFSSGLTVSKDRKTVLYSGVAVSQGSDLMLIRNFR